jgi:hypothetical protein
MRSFSSFSFLIVDKRAFSHFVMPLVRLIFPLRFLDRVAAKKKKKKKKNEERIRWHYHKTRTDTSNRLIQKMKMKRRKFHDNKKSRTVLSFEHIDEIKSHLRHLNYIDISLHCCFLLLLNYHLRVYKSNRLTKMYKTKDSWMIYYVTKCQ